MANKNFIVKNGLDVGGNVSANSRYTFDYNDHYLEAGTNSVAIKNGSGTSYFLATNTGVTIAGNLTVNGTTTTLNTANLTIDDKLITIADGAADAAAANESGINVAGASAQILYKSGNDRWEFNKEAFTAFGFMVGTTSTDVGLIRNSSGVFDFQAQSGRQISFSNVTNGEHMRIDADGKVGIGVAPSYPLDVTGPGTVTLAYQRTGVSGPKKWGFHSDSSNTYWQNLTDNVFGLTVSNTGNIGIGTLGPLDKLHVVKDSSTTNDIVDVARIEATSSGTPLVGFGPAIDFRAERGAASSDSVGRIGFVADTMTSTRVDGAFVVETAVDGTYTEYLRVTSTGNVGIATNAPRATLDIRGGHSSTVNEAISFGRTDDNYRYNSIYSRNTSSTNSYLSFKIHDGGSSVAQTETMVIGPGKVGIGTNAPQVKFHVNDGSGGVVMLTRTSANTTDDLGTVRWGNTNWDSNLAEIVGIQDGANDSARLEFKTQPSSAATTTRMTIKSGGNIGIANNDPSAKLHIGSANSMGNQTDPALQIGGAGNYRLGIYTTGEGAVYDNKNGDDGHIFNVKTAGEAMRIDGGTGNVGINNSTPQRRFVVTDSAGDAGDNSGILSLTVGSGINTDSKMQFGINSSHQGWIHVVKPGSNVYPLILNPTTSSGGKIGIGMGPTNTLSIKAHSGASSGGINLYHFNGNKVAELVHHGSGDEGRLSLYDGGSQTVQIHGESGQDSYINSGKVGIGTSSPTAKLDVRGSTGGGTLTHALFTGTTGRGFEIRTRSDVSGGQHSGCAELNSKDSEGTGGDIAFSSNGSVRMFIDGSGQVGINRTPSIANSKLEVGGADNVKLIVVEASGHTGGIGVSGASTTDRGFKLYSGGTEVAKFSNQTNVSYTSDGLLGASARPTRIACTTGSGELLIGYKDNGSGLYSGAWGFHYDAIDGLNNTSYVTGIQMYDTGNSTTHLAIKTNGNIQNTNNSYGSLSDERIKSDIIDANSQWDDIKALRIRKYKLATQPAPYNDQLQIGVIAQELEASGMNGLVQEEEPDLRHLEHDSSLVGQKIKSVKYSVLYMKAIKALQEAMDRIEQLEARVTELEE